MPEPLSLKFTSIVVCVRILLRENPVDTQHESEKKTVTDEGQCSGDTSTGTDRHRGRAYLTELLETGCFTAVSEDILHRIVKYCPDQLTNRLLHALIPSHVRELNLDSCLNVSLMGLVETLKKCVHVNWLNLTSCTQLIHPDVFTFTGLAHIPLTTVILEDNRNVTDEVVHAMLSNLRCLRRLHLSMCAKITDNVFLHNENLQLTREVTTKLLPFDWYSCQLTHVDISGCSQLTTVAVVHLVSLCGPSLKFVNLSWTAVNCIALLHLGGYSLPAIIDFLLTDPDLKSDNELKNLLQYYRELRDVYADKYEKVNTDDQLECKDKNELGEITELTNDGIGEIAFAEKFEGLSDEPENFSEEQGVKAQFSLIENENCDKKETHDSSSSAFQERVDRLRDFSKMTELLDQINVHFQSEGEVEVASSSEADVVHEDEIALEVANLGDSGGNTGDINDIEVSQQLAAGEVNTMNTCFNQAITTNKVNENNSMDSKCCHTSNIDKSDETYSGHLEKTEQDTVSQYNNIVTNLKPEMEGSVSNTIFNKDNDKHDFEAEVGDIEDNSKNNETLVESERKEVVSSQALNNSENKIVGKDNLMELELYEGTQLNGNATSGSLSFENDQCKNVSGDKETNKNDKTEMDPVKEAQKEGLINPTEPPLDLPLTCYIPYPWGIKWQQYKLPAVSVSEKLNFDYATQLFWPKIVNLNIAGMQFVSRRPNLGQLCLEKFLKVSQWLTHFRASWKGLTLDYFMKIVMYLKQLVEVDLEECTMLQPAGVAALARECTNLKTCNLRGVVFISDSSLIPFLANKNLQNLSLAEAVSITDNALKRFSKGINESLRSLDLSWCEEITEKGINAICSSCSNLTKLCLRKCPVSDFTLKLLAETCSSIVEISIESVDFIDEYLTDEGILTIANHFTQLRVIDVSWNLCITDFSLSAVMMNCSLLEEANFKGLKQITIQPFLPMISEEQDGIEEYKTSSVLPQRSTVYAPNLRVLDLDYSDLVNDRLLQKIVNVCRGMLQVTDYYGQKLVPE